MFKFNSDYSVNKYAQTIILEYVGNFIPFLLKYPIHLSATL